MIIDTHMHEKTFSDDSFLSLEMIVSRAKKLGLNGVCITDHESNGLKEYAQQYSRETGFLIIVGAEILTHEGDITVFGLDQLPTEKLYAQQLIDMTLKAGGIAMSAHPFRQNNRGMGNHIRNVKGLSGIEAFNGSTPHHHNMSAYHLAKELKIPTFGASDAHILEKVGQYATIFPNGIRDTKDFIEAVKDGITTPAVYTEKGYRAFDPHDLQTVSIFSNTFSQDLSSMVL
jgi:hypothetical protein